ncbi:NAD(P)-binding protein [Polychaeton citri CBS 116435]|uniref:NAD(P)-binding protein n=1 Tax=Polychaeton citri CBS 116435 TaxID=1314669 RepID=A0A9P4PWA7_9PEZI|nr:NAD(P)-binding protein [Polychaeton citri CBS 116435]
MDLLVLTDSDVTSLLASLDRHNAQELAAVLHAAFEGFSKEGENRYQPPRAGIPRPDGQLTLFSPCTSPSGVGTKITGCPPPPPPGTVPPSQKAAFMLCNAKGEAYGFLNASEFTAFRTSLGSMVLYRYRKATDNIVVFGAGKQALWHIRLALLLRGPEIKRITVVNRSSLRSQELLEKLAADDQSKWQSNVSIEVFDPSLPNKDARLEELLVESDVIFCTTPSRQPLFPAQYLYSQNARGKGRYLTAIGSFTHEMSELDPAIFKEIAATGAYHPKGTAGGAVFVDTREGCIEEAGEISKAGISHDHLVEVGSLPVFDSYTDGGKFMQSGFVLYKSVGFGIMDISVGESLIGLAKQKGFGKLISNF